ncbi:MAG: carboxynorspermidine decarboxylase [Muribaculaceae bacterium]|nr:carboxynorspermidine decarboxylase [Muribaculaceae bacterium]
MKNNYPTPYYIVFEDRLRRNLDLIKYVKESAGIEIIMAFKANALWRTFSVFREYGVKSTASSLNEMQLANDELQVKAHSYCPVYTDATIDKFLAGSSHITFNSLKQFNRYKERVAQHNAANPNEMVSCGVRINPMCSVVETDIYNPSSPGSRFGVVADDIKELPEGLEGFHFHALCESTSYDLEKVLEAVEMQFGKFLPKLKWLNMGGGHLMTREGYDVEHLITLLKNFRAKYPNLQIILEPGSAFTWRTSDLISSVMDVVTNHGIKTAILDVSFACHMPDCLEMPYQPIISEALKEVDMTKPTYRMGGNSCLSGDFVGDWSFDEELKEGDVLTFEDMNHYTTVKTHMFNGIQHPAMLYKHNDGTIEVLREFTYEDYKNRMS